MSAEVAQCDECRRKKRMWNMNSIGKFCRTCFEEKYL